MYLERNLEKTGHYDREALSYLIPPPHLSPSRKFNVPHIKHAADTITNSCGFKDTAVKLETICAIYVD